ncbi:hypothetical protein PINS_up009013 [Pythium insidiosum]|nr:hypothetical protein PINS_up009013 [Pythium insidiosum]
MKDGIWTQCESAAGHVALQVQELQVNPVKRHCYAGTDASTANNVLGLSPLSSALFSDFPKISISLDQIKPFLRLGEIDSQSVASKSPVALAALSKDAWQVGVSAIQVGDHPPVALPTQAVQLDIRDESSCLPADIYSLFTQTVLRTARDCKLTGGRIVCASTAQLPRLALELDGKTFFMNGQQYTTEIANGTEVHVQIESCKQSTPWRLGSTVLRSFPMVLDHSAASVTLYCDVGKTCSPSGIPLRDYASTRHSIASRTGSRQLRRHSISVVVSSDEAIVFWVVMIVFCVGYTFIQLIDCNEDAQEPGETQATAVAVPVSTQPVVLSPYYEQPPSSAVEKPYWELQEAPALVNSNNTSTTK